MIYEDQIDILIELTGHTAGNRLDVMALKPAPIQATWIGYPNTTGMRRIDYRFTDTKADPPVEDPGLAPARHSETLVPLPHSFLCYSPAPDAPNIIPLPYERNGFITFGTFNNLAKITTNVYQLWADILTALPTSRFVIKAKPFATESVRQEIWKIFQELGIDPKRVDLIPLIPLNRDHLLSYQLMDIGLDTHPYNGTTTTCEALWMGVPIITLSGDCHAHNVGASLLSQIGHPEWIAKTKEEYKEIAVSLAKDIDRLRNIRKDLKEQMRTSYLCNGPLFTENLEIVYRSLWHHYLDKQQGKETQKEFNFDHLPNVKLNKT